MERREEYMHQNKPLIRCEIEGHPPIITEKQRITHYRKKDWPTACIRWKGLHVLKLGDEEIMAVESVISDAGPVGVSLAFERPREIPPTQEEIQTNRAHIDRVLQSICGCRVDWNKYDEENARLQA